jgi:hypothetical protein
VRFPAIEELMRAVVGTAVGGGAVRRRTGERKRASQRGGEQGARTWKKKGSHDRLCA